MRTFILTNATLCVFAALTASADGSIFFPLDPRATFLHTDSTDSPAAPFWIELATLPFSASPGDFLVLERLGDFSFHGIAPQDGRSLMAVFSSTDELLSNTTLNRVPGAIDAGANYTTGPLLNGELNDISQDFFVPGAGNSTTSVTVQIPDKAKFLFFSPNDSFYSDNTDTDADGDYGVRISAPGGAVPEPSPLLVVLLGSATFGSLRSVQIRRKSAD